MAKRRKRKGTKNLKLVKDMANRRTEKANVPVGLLVSPPLPPGQALKKLCFVVVPTMDNRMTIGVVSFLAMLDRLNHSPTSPWAFQWEVINGRRPVEYARNYLAGRFLYGTQAEKIWFIDNDMIPDASALEMLQVDADIVAGRAWAFDHGNPENEREPGLKLCLFNYNELGDFKFNPLIPKEGDSIVDIEAAGTATMLISRRVLEDRRMWFDTKYEGLDGEVKDLEDETLDPKWAPPIFKTQYKPNGQILRGEDLDFCLRAHNLEYSLKGHLGARFGHLKEVDLDHVVQIVNNTLMRARKGVKTESNVKTTRTNIKPKEFAADLKLVKAE